MLKVLEARQFGNNRGGGGRSRGLRAGADGRRGGEPGQGGDVSDSLLPPNFKSGAVARMRGRAGSQWP